MVPPVQEPELGLPADHQAEVGGKAQLDLLARAVGPHDGAADGHQDVLGDGVDQLQVEGPLGGEVLVEERFRDAGRFGDVVHRRGAVPPLCEEFESHLHQLLAPLLCGEPPGGCLYRARHHCQVTEGSETRDALEDRGQACR